VPVIALAALSIATAADAWAAVGPEVAVPVVSKVEVGGTKTAPPLGLAYFSAVQIPEMKNLQGVSLLGFF